MAPIQKQRSKKKNTSLSKGFTEGINTLYDEIQLAMQWHRPSILLAIHHTTGGQFIAQQFLEKRLIKDKKNIHHIKADNNVLDVITSICSTPNHEKTVFFVTGLGNANQLSNGEVYRGLNIHREHLVEQKVCAVFWLTETEAANLPHHAPDFWAFRHRVVEFAPQRGPRNPSIPSGMFLWNEQLPWLNQFDLKKQVAYNEDLLAHLPSDESATTSRLNTTFKLIQLNWQLNQPKYFFKYFDDILTLLRSKSNHQHHGWALNIKGIKLFEDGDRQAARACLDQALTFDPNNSLLMMNSAIMAHGTGKNKEAIQTAYRALKIDANNPCLWHTLGQLYLSMGKFQNAVESTEKALEKDPDNLNILITLAICYSKNSQPEASGSLLKDHRRIESNILPSACRSVLSGNIDEALQKLRQALVSTEINQHQVFQDPNIFALLGVQSLMSLDQ